MKQPEHSFLWLLIILVLSAVVGIFAFQAQRAGLKPIKIGVLHSLTGTMAVSEKPLVDAVRLAVEEINERGGLLGRRVEMIVVDGQSDQQVFAQQAERLIRDEKVSALFACWTSACRKAVKPIVERYQNLMFYAVQYEGMEQSPNILYAGSAPNQQIVPGTRWAMQKFGKRVYLLGSDYVFPRTANLIIRDLVQSADGEVLAERYLPLGSSDVKDIVADIIRLRPDVVLNTVNGDSNAYLFDEMEKSGLIGLPLISFSLAESEMKEWGGGRFNWHFGVWSYFQSLDSERNRQFLSLWQSHFGLDSVTDDPVEAQYVSFFLWAQAVQDAGTDEASRVNSSLMRQSFNGPSSVVAVDAATRHLWKMVRVGQVLADGQFRIVYSSSAPIRPAPWPGYRSHEAWRVLLNDRLP